MRRRRLCSRPEGGRRVTRAVWDGPCRWKGLAGGGDGTKTGAVWTADEEAERAAIALASAPR